MPTIDEKKELTLTAKDLEEMQHALWRIKIDSDPQLAEKVGTTLIRSRQAAIAIAKFLNMSLATGFRRVRLLPGYEIQGYNLRFVPKASLLAAYPGISI